MWMTTAVFIEFLGMLDAFIGLQVTNILLLADNLSARPQDMSFLQDIKVVHFPLTITA